jgi:hypothetical protein
MVLSKGILEFIPKDNMTYREHSKVVVPPKTSRTAKLLCGKVGLALIGTWHNK